MDYFTKLFSRISSHFQQLGKWMNEDPRNIVIVILCSIAIIAGAVLLINILPYLLLVAVVLFAFSDEIKDFFSSQGIGVRRLTLDTHEVYQVITRFMFAVINTRQILDGVTAPLASINDIYDPRDFLGNFNGVPLLKLRLMRRNLQTALDTDFLRVALQTFIDARLLDGYLIGYPWAIPADVTTPLVKVATVYADGRYLYIEILLTNSTEGVNASRLADTPALTQSGDDIDPLFAEED